MRKLLMILFFGILLIGCKSNDSKKNSNSFYENIVFASKSEGIKLLEKEDAFTNHFSQFDVDSRVGKRNSTTADYLREAAKEPEDWTSEEIKNVKKIVLEISNQLEKLDIKINFPKIPIIKASMELEAKAQGYTRDKSIVLYDKALSGKDESLRHLITHELFHVLTRNNPKFREKIYSIIGFKLMKEIEIPASLKDYTITNPDAPYVDSYITLKKDDKDIKCTMFIYSDRNFDGGTFMNYIHIGLFKLDDKDISKVEFKDGKPVYYSLNEVSNFFEQVGKNTRYIINPEEILAENFVYSIWGNKKLPNQEILNKILILLKDKKIFS